MKLEFSNPRTLDSGLADTRLPLLLIATLSMALAAAFAISHLLPADAVLPALVILMFASAIFVALSGLLSGRGIKQALFDVAGVFTFIGIVIAAAVEPDQMAGLMEGVRAEN